MNRQAERLTDITSTISALAGLVQENLIRQVSEGPHPFLRDYETGALMTAIKELSLRVEELADDRGGES